jgi:hypothetical protein
MVSNKARITSGYTSYTRHLTKGVPGIATERTSYSSVDPSGLEKSENPLSVNRLAQRPALRVVRTGNHQVVHGSYGLAEKAAS